VTTSGGGKGGEATKRKKAMVDGSGVTLFAQQLDCGVSEPSTRSTVTERTMVLLLPSLREGVSGHLKFFTNSSKSFDRVVQIPLRTNHIGVNVSRGVEVIPCILKRTVLACS
jgi:hypothetical protein